MTGMNKNKFKTFINIKCEGQIYVLNISLYSLNIQIFILVKSR